MIEITWDFDKGNLLPTDFTSLNYFRSLHCNNNDIDSTESTQEQFSIFAYIMILLYSFIPIPRHLHTETDRYTVTILQHHHKFIRIGLRNSTRCNCMMLLLLLLWRPPRSLVNFIIVRRLLCVLIQLFSLYISLTISLMVGIDIH